MIASAGISHIVVSIQRPREMELELAALDPAQLVVGQPEVGEPVEEVGLEDLARAVEAVTRQPDHLLLGEAEGSGVIELGPELALVDLLGELHRRACG